MREGARDSLGRRVVLSILLALLFVAIGGIVFRIHLGLRREPAKAPPGPPRIVVRAEVAERASFRERLSGYGLARALRRAQVSAEVAGLVTWLSPHLEAGSAVAKGEELVRLDRRDFVDRVSAAKARARQAEAALSRAKTDLESLGRRLSLAEEDLATSKRELERIRGLVAEGVERRSELDRQLLLTSQKERAVVELTAQVETARTELRRADAEVAAREAALGQAEHDLLRTAVRAPFAGRIEERRAELGSLVTPGSPLFTAVDLSRVEVPVALGARHYGEVRPGAAARIRLREDGPVVWRGNVARVAPGVDSANRTFFAYLVVEGEGGESPVPPGAFVCAEVDGLLHDSVIAVPRVAFVGDRLYVAEPAGDGEAVIHEVRPEVRRRLPDAVLLAGGVEPGARIVVTSLEQIADGSRVRLAREPAAVAADPGGGGAR